MSSVISIGIHDLIDGELVLGVKDLRNHGKGCFLECFVCVWMYPRWELVCIWAEVMFIGSAVCLEDRV